MENSKCINVVAFVLCSLIHASFNIDHYDIESLAVSCPERDKCAGYKHDKNFTERGCECDAACTEYNDCCVDYRRKSQSSQRKISSEFQNRMECQNIGEHSNTGVYVIATCADFWFHSLAIDLCEGPDDFRNPVMAAPVTNIDKGITYRNYYCARCNFHSRPKLEFFQTKLLCEGFQNISDKEILDDLVYSRWHESWGIIRLHNKNETRFHSCSILFDAPPHLYKSLRFCRANLVDTCSHSWRGEAVKRRCEQYMAVVHDDKHVYRNPHCAFCNFKSVDEIFCKSDYFTRIRSDSILLNLSKKYWTSHEIPLPACPKDDNAPPLPFCIRKRLLNTSTEI